jgi:hypothetical protein
MKATLLLPAIFVLSVSLLWAADAAVPIWEATTIDEPGNYILTRDFGDGTGQDTDPSIVITADNVDLDLNGFMVSIGEPAIKAEGVTGLAIHNGTAIGYDDALWVIDSRNVVLRQLRIRSGDDNGILITNSSNVLVDDSLFLVSPGYAINASGDNITLRNSQIENVRVYFAGSAARIVGNSFLGTNVEILASGSVFAENSVVGGLGVRIAGSGNLVADNLVRDASDFGLRLTGSDNVYRGNVARGNGGNPVDCANESATPDFCDEGVNNTSGGGNFVPDEM